MENLTSNIIAAVGVLVTGTFSYFVWKATNATAQVANATFELSKELAQKEDNRREEYKRIMRRQLLSVISKESKIVYDAVVDIDPMNILMKLRDAPVYLSINKTELAEYFSVDEVATIIKAWETYESYRTKYYKETYRGNELKLLLEKNQPVIIHFEELKDKLNNIEI
ncbi:hypothetical protein PB01_08145 [Psychrobacillus glaciei]|uniref:Uncharacterized protein n=1 Tax=Psychrobacillus glaciei TaxID=2283160 RepID=A0A5J6SLL0_9BACI|nr:hypothetical protein [Psychrobacillus glaciei]QFF98805.1 hypothetical protein PB01_08145 [Psychrobacillus glaciei]